MSKESEKERRDTLAIAEHGLWLSKEKSDSQRILSSVVENWSKWPVSKLNRWIGYAQHQLVSDEIITLEQLRTDVHNIINKP